MAYLKVCSLLICPSCGYINLYALDANFSGLLYIISLESMTGIARGELALL